MLFSARNALQVLIAIVSIAAVHADYDYDMLESRELEFDYLSQRDLGGMLGHQEAYSRGYSDGGDFVLSRRDLAHMGVRSDDISHVLVVRAGSRSPSPASKETYEKQLAVHKKGLRDAKAKLKTAKEKQKEFKNDAKKLAFWKEEAKSANEMIHYEEEEIKEYEKLLKI